MMDDIDINNEYFNWLLNYIYNDELENCSKILWKLFTTSFDWINILDENRASDGLRLRHDYIYETGLSPDLPEKCTCLEMIIALCIRMEMDIMWDPELGDRTYIWFNHMIKNLGFYCYTDDIYDESYANRVLDDFINLRYCKDGSGGLFKSKNAAIDIRNYDIWKQMHMHINSMNLL